MVLSPRDVVQFTVVKRSVPVCVRRGVVPVTVMKGARCGFTLVEAMLAGAIAVLMTLALMEGLVVSAKVSHENSELLAAEAFAWDTAWRWLNKAHEHLEKKEYPQDGVGVEMSSNDCPVIYRADSPAKCYVHMETISPSNVGTGEVSVAFSGLRRIEVDVEWGPADARVCLSGGSSLSDAPQSYNVPIAVMKGNVDRGRKPDK